MEKHEDAVISREFCEKVHISGKDIVLPPLSALPKRYSLHFKRKSERKLYRFSGFELTVSRETSIRYDGVNHPEELCKVPSHDVIRELQPLRTQGILTIFFRLTFIFTASSVRKRLTGTEAVTGSLGTLWHSFQTCSSL